MIFIVITLYIFVRTNARAKMHKISTFKLDIINNFRADAAGLEIAKNNVYNDMEEVAAWRQE